ncbi:MAG TPA: photosystem P840 reaction center protein PscD, partial [Puia sp.]|nr:photosystem P840 reaction center protein PscD [Puia sp.]
KAAIEYCLNIGVDKIGRQVKVLSGMMREELSKLDKIRVLDKGPDLGGLVTFTVRGAQPQHLVDQLLKRKINVVPSYRNFAIIDFDEKGVKWALRASPHYYNTQEEIQEFLSVLADII